MLDYLRLVIPRALRGGKWMMGVAGVLLALFATAVADDRRDLIETLQAHWKAKEYVELGSALALAVGGEWLAIIVLVLVVLLLFRGGWALHRDERPSVVTVEEMQLLWASNEDGTLNDAYCPWCRAEPGGPFQLYEPPRAGKAQETAQAGVDEVVVLYLECRHKSHNEKGGLKVPVDRGQYRRTCRSAELAQRLREKRDRLL